MPAAKPNFLSTKDNLPYVVFQVNNTFLLVSEVEEDENSRTECEKKIVKSLKENSVDINKCIYLGKCVI